MRVTSRQGSSTRTWRTVRAGIPLLGMDGLVHKHRVFIIYSYKIVVMIFSMHSQESRVQPFVASSAEFESLLSLHSSLTMRRTLTGLNCSLSCSLFSHVSSCYTSLMATKSSTITTTTCNTGCMDRNPL